MELLISTSILRILLISTFINDNELKAVSHFFATSPAKNPCECIGGTVKRLITRASLQSTPILNINEMHEW